MFSRTVTSAEPQDWIIALHSIKNHVLFSVLSITASPLLRRQSDSIHTMGKHLRCFKPINNKHCSQKDFALWKSRMKQPSQRPAEALKLFPIKRANSAATEVSHHLVYVLEIWFGLNWKYIYLFLLNTKWLLNVLLLTFNYIQTLKFNLCEINELVVSQVYVFNQEITFKVLKGILIKVYQKGSMYLNTNTNAKYTNTYACNYQLPCTF